MLNIIRPQLVESAHSVKVYNNYALTLIIYKVTDIFHFYLLLIFHKKNIT